MSAFYNEIDPYAAAWLRNLIAAGHIAPGVVDERSIEDIEPAELARYTQCHFFAGIGAWSYALRLAGWPDDRPVWTGSCPCQPFSSAGKGAGFADERHLWPAFHWLISQCRPAVVFGEQVASKDGLEWLDLVRTDLEASGYAAGAADLCAAGIGAPHIRQRLYWVADALHAGRPEGWPIAGIRPTAGSGESDGLADADSEDQRRRGIQRPRQGDGEGDGSARERPARLCTDGWLDHHHHQGLEGQRDGHRAEVGHGPGQARSVAEAGESGRLADADCERRVGQHTLLRAEETGRISSDLLEVAGGRPTHGFWGDADWLFCRDGKWRPVEPGTFPLAHGAPARVGRLRAYGNAIVPQVAQTFIEAYLTRP